jgi:hypothetical protein
MKRQRSADIFAELQFASSHFYDLQTPDVCGLTVSELSAILSNDSLRIVSEDTLFDVLNEYISRSPDHFGVIEFVHFEYLSAKSIASFVDLSQNFLSSINSSIWHRICQRLIVCECHPIPTSRFMKSLPVHCPFRPHAPLDGVISQLARQCGCNVHDGGVVHVTSGSVFRSSFEPKNAADFATDKCFGSRQETDAWLCYEFRGRSVRPTHYSIRSWNVQSHWASGDNLVSWVIEVSGDGSTWTEVDRRVNNRTCVDGAVGSFAMSDVVKQCRYVRIRQIGKTWPRGENFLVVSAFEIFGEIYSE